MEESIAKAGEATSQSGKGSAIGEYPYAQEPYYWTLDLQETQYRLFFDEKDIDSVLQFRKFIESLAHYHHREPMYEFNPVILAISYYPTYLDELFSSRPDLFTHGHCFYGDYDISPIIHTLRNSHLKNLEFFFDHEIEQKEELPYGTGTRHVPCLGGNFLTEAKWPEMEKYLLEKGIETELEKPAPDYFYFLSKDEVNIFEEPGYDKKVIDRISKDTKIEALTVTMYKRNNSQWIKIRYNGDKEGWVTEGLGFYFDTGV